MSSLRKSSNSTGFFESEERIEWVKSPNISSATGGYRAVDFTYTENYPGAGTFIKSQGICSDQLSIYRQTLTKWSQSIYAPGKTTMRIGSRKDKNDILIDDDADVDAVHTMIVYLGRTIFIIERGANPITCVNGTRTPCAVLEDRNPILLSVGKTNFIIRPKRSIPARGQSKGETFSLKSPDGEQHATFNRCNIIGSHSACDLKFDGPEFMAMIIPCGKSLYMLPSSEMIYDGSAVLPLKACLLSSGHAIDSIGATVIVPEGIAGGPELDLRTKVPECLEFTEILATEEPGPVRTILPPAGSSFIISRRDAQGYFHIESSFISREHAQVVVYDRSIVVEDLKSRNGTFVNGEKISSKEVWPGDFLSVGDRTFLLGYSTRPKN